MLSGGLSFAGKWLGASIAMAGHTDDSSMREIVIGNNVIAAPANAIRFERQRTNGVAGRLDLYNAEIVHWWAGSSSDLSNLLVQNGEAGAIGSPPALINAICHALGVKDVPMPASPYNVWKAAQAAA